MILVNLSDDEFMVMKCLWDVGLPLSAREIMERLDAIYVEVIKETTLYMLMNRLKEKGFIKSHKNGITYFMPVISEEEFLNDFAVKLSKFLGKKATDEFISDLCKTRK